MKYYTSFKMMLIVQVACGSEHPISKSRRMQSMCRSGEKQLLQEITENVYLSLWQGGGGNQEWLAYSIVFLFSKFSTIACITYLFGCCRVVYIKAKEKDLPSLKHNLVITITNF